MRVAIAHYWFVSNRGGEKVIEEICKLYPDADLFTLVHDPEHGPPFLADKTVIESWIAKLPRAREWYQKYLPFMPRALEDLDLSGYDLVISSESGPAKGVIVDPDATHVCYCHSPMRYLYDQRHHYIRDRGRVSRLAYSLIAHRLRQWDYTSAQRVDAIATNSRFIGKRVTRVWKRDSQVIHPPVDVDRFAQARQAPVPPAIARTGIAAGDYFVVFGEVAPYKRVDIAVEACAQLDLPLVVAGDGADLERIKTLAGPRTVFLGRVPNGDVPGMLAHAKALIFPGVEDFGIVPLEAAACGTPTIAFRAAGATETVLDGQTGTFFDAQTCESVCAALTDFDPSRYSAPAIVDWAESFRPEVFRSAFADFVRTAMENKRDRATGSTNPLPITVAR